MSTAISGGSVCYAEFSPDYRPPQPCLEAGDSKAANGGVAVWYDSGFLMLRAAFIGFASSGKSTLFQLMTSAVGTARAAHGKGETTVGISKVPDRRLDTLTAMYNPKT